MLVRLLLVVLLVTGCSELSAPEPEGPLTGQRLVEELRDGGYVLYLRHAITDADAADGLPTDPCSKQRGLTEEGQQQARDIGQAVQS
ncbi:MAG: histidine phosphatase family protein, partial [Frankiales bacterium]